MIGSSETLCFRHSKYLYLAWLAIIVGVFLRFWGLSIAGLWSDELYTVSAALDVGRGHPWLSFQPKVIQQLTINDSFLTWKAADNTPPLFELLLIMWAKLFGESDLALRSLTAVLGSAAPIVMYYGMRHNIGERSAVVAAVLLALSPSAIIYSQEVRSYTLTLLLCSIAMARLTLHVARNKGEVERQSIWPDIFLYTLMAYSHYTGLFMAGLLAAIYIVFISIPNARFADVAKFLVVPLAIAPWLWLTRKAFAFSSNGGYAWRDYRWEDIYRLMIPETFNFFLPGGGLVFAAVWIGACAMGVAFLHRFHRADWDKGYSLHTRLVQLALCFALATCLLFLYSVYNAFTAKMWHARYFLVALPLVFTSLSLLLFNIKSKYVTAFLLAIVLLLSFVGIYRYFDEQIYAKEDYRGASSYIANEAREGAVILLGWQPNEAYYRHYLDKDLSMPAQDYIIRAVSTLEDVKEACRNYERDHRVFFISQHQSHTPYSLELSKCSGMIKVDSRNFRGILVEKYIYEDK